MTVIRWSVAAASDLGLARESNEDAYHTDPKRGLFIAADGMGGHAAGEIASRLAVEAVADRLTEAVESSPVDLPDGWHDEVLEAAFECAQRRIHEWARTHPTSAGLGTTLTAMMLDPDGVLRAAHVGDSRLYLFRDRSVRPLTRDHTWVAREVDEGRIPAARARNHPFSHILTNVVTDDPPLRQIDIVREPVSPGDLLLLCTDGLHGLVSDATLEVVCTRDEPLDDRVAGLVDEAIRAGGTDNITCILVQIED